MVYLVVAATIIGSILSKAGSGTIYVMAQLTQRRMTRQMAEVMENCTIAMIDVK